MMKYRSVFFGVLLCGIFAAAALYYFQFRDRNHPSISPPVQMSGWRAHAYKAPDRSIDSIRLRVLYAVPSDKSAHLKSNWREVISGALADVSRFHTTQFRGFSKILPDLFPEPILLEHESSFYDSEKTSAGNPHALVAVASEIERRVFAPSGDMYRKDFAFRDSGEYAVMGIVYEGVGASGGLIYDSPLKTAEEIASQLGLSAALIHIVGVNSADGFFLVNSNCLVRASCEEPGSSLIYHEFAHALGIDDEYAGSENFSEDIMGLGRFKPLDATYLDRNILMEMGVL